MSETAAAGRQAAAGAGRPAARLLAAAAELISEGGYAAASVVAIAERAGRLGGALYRHFPSKVDLFSGAVQDLGRRCSRRCTRRRPERGSWLERLDAVLTTYASTALADRG